MKLIKVFDLLVISPVKKWCIKRKDVRINGYLSRALNGSLYSRSAKLSASPLLGTAIEMIAGGLLLLIASLVFGEWYHLRLDHVSLLSLISWIYLILLGSLVGLARAYIWLLKTVPPAQASTYAYVNPIIAMLLGSALAHEPITARNVVAAALILAAVVIITTFRSHGKQNCEQENSTR